MSTKVYQGSKIIPKRKTALTYSHKRKEIKAHPRGGILQSSGKWCSERTNTCFRPIPAFSGGWFLGQSVETNSVFKHLWSIRPCSPCWVYVLRLCINCLIILRIENNFSKASCSLEVKIQSFWKLNTICIILQVEKAHGWYLTSCSLALGISFLSYR